MIPEYKLFHGAVLAELIQRLSRPVSVDELSEEGRLSSYILDGAIGMHVKHSGSRLTPWQFTFTRSNLAELLSLQLKYSEIYVVLVCNTDGMVCLGARELASVLAVGEADQAWLRVERRPGQWYTVSGSGSELRHKKPKGLDDIVHALDVTGAIPG